MSLNIDFISADEARALITERLNRETFISLLTLLNNAILTVINSGGESCSAEIKHPAAGIPLSIVASVGYFVRNKGYDISSRFENGFLFIKVKW